MTQLETIQYAIKHKLMLVLVANNGVSDYPIKITGYPRRFGDGSFRGRIKSTWWYNETGDVDNTWRILCPKGNKPMENI